MPFDFTKSREASRIIAEKKASYVERNYINFKVGEDKPQIVRFLDSASAYCHQVQLPGQKYPDWVVSLDQSSYPGIDSPCPLVQAGSFKRSLRGWVTLIWRDAPKIKRDSENKVVKDNAGNYIFVGTADQIAVWQTGSMVFESLDETDATYHGLSSRDFRVKRKGMGMDTRYTISPADVDGGAVAMSPADVELAKKLPDLKQLSTAKSAEALRAYIEGDATALRDVPSPEQQVADNNKKIDEIAAKNPWGQRATATR